MNEAYGRFVGTVTLPEEYRLGLIPPAEKEFPWKWIIIGGVIIGLIFCIATE